jgi:serine/threonine-protein kinase HipA
VGARRPDALPGFLADSLPDAWGRLLIDRAVRRAGLEPRALRGVDRLLLVGDRGIGALTFAPAVAVPTERPDAGAASVDLDALSAAAQTTLAGREAELVDQLARMGGSAGGTRPKVFLAERPDGTLRGGAGPLADDEVGWLLKFRAPAHDPADVGACEFAYARMAQAAGLDVATPRLFEGRRGRYFGARRFDRQGARRLHVLTAAGLLDVDASGSVGFDYADLIRLTRHVTRDERQTVAAFRHAVFNVLGHNRDDHLRQFGFLRTAAGWQRAPAYDLTHADGPGGEHTLLVAGEGRAPGRAALLRLAAAAALPTGDAERTLAEVADALSNWRTFAAEAGVGRTSTARIGAAIKAALAR